MGGLMVNTSTIISGNMVTELLSSEVDEEVTIPRIIQSDVKEMFVRKVGVDGGTGGVQRGGS
jgi:hypothetical protein